ncbi:MAG: MFS transporter [Deltaproteobacteria bacterium]|nr:MFS transporter [Deltaproteobacteria bacterium]
MAPPPARNERNVLLLTGVGHFATHYFELMFPTLAVALARQTETPLEEVLSWSFFGYLFFGLGALPVGLLADRLNARLLLLVSLFGLGVTALAASEAHTPRALTVCLAAMGAFASIYHPVGMSLISRTIDARGRALGVNGIFGNAAIAITPVLTAYLCAHFGWPDTFRLVGYAMFILAVACAFLPVHEQPRRVLPTAPRDATRVAWRPLLVLYLAAALAGISYRGNTLLQPAYFSQHVSEIGYGAATSIAYALGIVGQYVGGRCADRFELRRLYLLFHACSLPALLAMTLFAGLPLIGSAALFIFFSLGMQPIENSLFAQMTPPRQRALFYGVKFACTFGVGSLAVFLVRWADGIGGLSYALLCLAGVVTLVIAAAASLVSMGRESERAPAVPALAFPPLKKGGEGGFPN